MLRRAVEDATLIGDGEAAEQVVLCLMEQGCVMRLNAKQNSQIFVWRSFGARSSGWLGCLSLRAKENTCESM